MVVWGYAQGAVHGNVQVDGLLQVLEAAEQAPIEWTASVTACWVLSCLYLLREPQGEFLPPGFKLSRGCCAPDIFSLVVLENLDHLRHCAVRSLLADVQGIRLVRTDETSQQGLREPIKEVNVLWRPPRRPREQAWYEGCVALVSIVIIGWNV